MLKSLIFSLLPHTPSAIHKEIFTTNAVCSGRHCINPIFPGLEAINTLSSESFSCQTLSDAQPSLNFCSGAVDYNPSLPFASGSTKTVSDLVQEQEQKAMTTYFLHLNAMGLEAWDFQEPQNGDDPCIQAVWRLACYTYFPKTPRNCLKNQEASYVRPCASSCSNYVNQCKVECCDESVQCSFEHSSKVGDNTITTFGFAPHEGPSMFCTGNACAKNVLFALLLPTLINFRGGLARALTMPLVAGYMLLFGAEGVNAINQGSGSLGGKQSSSSILSNGIAGAVNEVESYIQDTTVSEAHSFMSASLLQTGSKTSTKSIDVTDAHAVGNWRKKSDYLIEFQYVPPGSTSSAAILNSCSLPNLAQTLQCNGRGMCKTFNPTDIANPVLFCQCERDYADPECRTKRKSQVTAFMLSVFLGVFGVDRFYLGLPVSGALKLVSLGGFGFWWVADIVYIGSAPVYAGQYRLAANLPHWFYVAFTVTTAIVIGFAVSFCSTSRTLTQKRKAAFLYHSEEGITGFQGRGIHAKKPPQPQVSFGGK